MVASATALKAQCGEAYVGSCQNYGPVLGPYYDTAPII